MHRSVMQKDRRIFTRLPIYVAICVAILSGPSIYFHFIPLPAFNSALAVYEGQTSIVMGGRDGFSGGERYHRRNYVLLPSFFYNPKIIKVAQVGSESPKVTESSATFPLCAFFAFVVLYLISLVRRNRPNNQ